MDARPAIRRVGILGGMGPQATVLLMARVIARTEALDDGDHVPLIVDNNTQVPSRIKAILEKSGADPGPTLAEMAGRLATGGAEALAMPCNTAHFYAPVIEDAVQIPLLNMLELTANRVASLELSNRTVGVLASPAARLTGIFEQTFFRLRIKTLYPTDQDKLLGIIRAIKSNSKDPDARHTLGITARELVDQGADVLLIACSELSIIADAIPPAFSCLDTIEVLAEEIIKYSGAKLNGN